jgi:hypothetical protein
MSIVQSVRRLVGAVFVVSLAASPVQASSGDKQSPMIASFEGTSFDMATAWGQARACTTDGQTARCYRTEAEMDAAENGRDVGPSSVLTACTTATRLYAGTSYSGSVLQLTTRFVLHNLSPLGFDNVTSSYKIGGCSASFYDTTSGGSLYPGNTSAGVWSASMVSGWDNRVGSVYIS